MFSEYASRFLAQSQTRMSAIREGRPTREAPLFFSVADHLPDDHEHDQEVQDFYALKGSRRHFGAYAESAVDEEEEEEDGRGLGESSDSIPDPRRNRNRPSPLGLGTAAPGGIGSDWRQGIRRNREEEDDDEEGSLSSSRGTNSTAVRSHQYKGKDRMEDIRLDDSVRLGMVPEKIDPTDMLSPTTTRGGGEGPSRFSPGHGGGGGGIAIDMEGRDLESPPPSQYFYRSPSMSRAHSPSIQQHIKSSPFMPTQVEEAQYLQGSMSQSMPAPVAHPPPDPPMHDAIWSSLYLVSMAGMFATGFLSWIKTNESKLLNPIDTIHTVIHSHIHLLAVDTVIAVGVSLLWMYLLRRFMKLLMYALLVTVPIILVAMSIWPFVQSYKGNSTTQDTAMRWVSLVPAIMSVMWVYVAHKGRNAIGRGMGIIQLSCKILGENPALVLLSFATLLGTVVFTWMWVGMFQSVFLYGKVGLVGGVPMFYLDTTTWFIGGYFVVMYLWTLGVAAGIQRATSAATVSQWYYYRHAIPAVSSRDVMDAALHHSFTILFGTICFSAFSALMIRLPILVLPRRVVGVMHLFCFNFVASPIVALTHPLTLTYAAIHSQPLVYSSRMVAGMRVLDAQPGVNGAVAGGGKRHPRAAYKLAKMLLTGTRAVMALGLGIGAWVGSARGDHGGGGAGGGHIASLYGYVVGMIAGAIGWGVLGATEGCLGNVVDACLVCVGSEPGEGGHCREAQMVFGG